MLAIAQYIIYVVVGAFYCLVIATYMGVAAGFGILALLLLFIPLFLFGFVSGLSFFLPRIAAASAVTLALPFLYIGVSSIFIEANGVEPSIFVIPSAAVVLVSVFALLWSKSSQWARQTRMFGKVTLGVSSLIPALLAVWMLSSIILWLSSFD